MLGMYVLFAQGHRHLGHQHSDRLGIRDHQLRLVDRYRPRRNADFGDSVSAEAGLAHIDQPVLGSDDAVRRGLRRHVPDSAPGPAVAGLLAVSLSQFHVALAAAAQPARVGRVCGFDVRHRLARLLVHRPDSGSGHACAIPRHISGSGRSYGILALGWRGSAIHWHRYQKAYLLLAGLATPLVLSVHTIVSFDFAISIIPGWHTTIFPPYFVAGAIYSGFAMVLTLIIPLRSWYNMQDLITLRHIEAAAKLMLGTGLIVAYGYSMEAFFSWYSGDKYESFMYWNRMTGPYGFTYALLDSVQYSDTAGAVVEQGPSQHHSGLDHLDHRQHRHVAGAFRHRRDQPAPRFSAVFLGHLHPDEMGLGDLHRNARILHVPDFPLRARAALDLDFRSARSGASRSARAARTVRGRMSQSGT